MKIAHIGNVALKANGVGEVITNLSMAQRQSGHDVMVLTAKVKKRICLCLLRYIRKAALKI